MVNTMSLFRLQKGKYMDNKEKVRDLERRLFLLQMKDNWSREDFDYSRRLEREIRELKEKDN